MAAGDPIAPEAPAISPVTPATIDAATASASKYKDVMGALNEMTKLAGNTIEQVWNNLSKINLDSITDQLSVASSGINDFGAQGGFALLAMSNVIKVNADLFGQLGVAGKQSGLSIAEGFTSLKPFLEKIPLIGLLAPGLERVASAADQFQSLETGIIAAAAASGNLNNIMGAVHENFDGLDDVAAQYNAQINDAATRSGMLIPTVAKYAAELMKIPGALTDTTYEFGESAGKTKTSVNDLSDGMKVAAAYGLNLADVSKRQNELYTKFNIEGGASLSIIAKMAKASQDLEVPMEIINSSTMKIADSFKLFGDNTSSALTIVSAFQGALKDTTSKEAITEVVEGFSSGIKSMDTAQQAFISAQSGGKGGIAGAMHVQFLQQQGKMDEVAEMARKAMTRQFGRISTTADVEKNAALAPQVLKEQTMLINMGLAKDQGSANKLIEFLATGKKIEEKKDVQKVLSEAIDRGDRFQQKQTSDLISIANAGTIAQQLTAASSYALLQTMKGTAEKGMSKIPTGEMASYLNPAVDAFKSSMNVKNLMDTDALSGMAAAIAEKAGAKEYIRPVFAADEAKEAEEKKKAEKAKTGIDLLSVKAEEENPARHEEALRRSGILGISPSAPVAPESRSGILGISPSAPVAPETRADLLPPHEERLPAGAHGAAARAIGGGAGVRGQDNLVNIKIQIVESDLFKVKIHEESKKYLDGVFNITTGSSK
jgi:hypothetical protein